MCANPLRPVYARTPRSPSASREPLRPPMKMSATNRRSAAASSGGRISSKRYVRAAGSSPVDQFTAAQRLLGYGPLGAELKQPEGAVGQRAVRGGPTRRDRHCFIAPAAHLGRAGHVEQDSATRCRLQTSTPFRPTQSRRAVRLRHPRADDSRLPLTEPRNFNCAETRLAHRASGLGRLPRARLPPISPTSRVREGRPKIPFGSRRSASVFATDQPRNLRSARAFDHAGSRSFLRHPSERDKCSITGRQRPAFPPRARFTGVAADAAARAE